MDNVFIAPPGWSWDVARTFFGGRLTAGICFVASMLRLTGRRNDLRLSRSGSCLAFPLATIGASLLAAGKNLRDLQGSLMFLAALTTVQAVLFPDHLAVSLALLSGVTIGLRMGSWYAIYRAIVSLAATFLLAAGAGLMVWFSSDHVPAGERGSGVPRRIDWGGILPSAARP